MRCIPVLAAGDPAHDQSPIPTRCRPRRRAGCCRGSGTCRPSLADGKPRKGTPNNRQGMSLIEMLVAMTITLILIFAMVQLFQSMGDSMTVSRASMELNGQMRNAVDRFRQDLDMLTVPTRPPVDHSSGLGYLEIIEGSGNDRVFPSGVVIAGGDPNDDILGDFDDMIMFTATSRGQPFIGRYQGATIESQDAEIVWWTVLDDLNGNNTQDPGEYFTLYRRVLLIMPALNTVADGPNGIKTTGNNLASEAALTTFQQQNDVSIRMEGSKAVANSLADLGRRSSRFAHVQGQTNYPNLINVAADQNRLLPLSGARLGEDIVITNVLAFDLRVFDPTAPVRANAAGTNGVPLKPTDPGWSAATQPAGFGAYVDLGYTGTTLSQFSHVPYSNQTGRPFLTSCFTDNRPSRVYDTWTNYYEMDTIDQDLDNVYNEGANGIDDDNIFGPDSPGELEAPPPYEHPLRGMQMVLRITEIPTRQVMQSSVSVDFSTD